MQTSPENSPETSAENRSPNNEISSPRNSPVTAGLEEEGGELPEEESVRSVTNRFLKWTKEDTFDWNPEYAKTVRGIATLLQMLLSALVMIMVGSGCAQANSSSFVCHSSAAFMFVVACSALIQSTLLVVCCLLSKKGDAILHAAALELLYYIVFFIFYLTGGLILEANLSSNDYGHHAILAGGVFGLTNSGLYFLSAIWSFVCFKKRFSGRDGN